MFQNLYKTYVRSHLDACSSVWAPYKLKHIEQIEKVQMRATKQIPGFRDLTYPERLRRLKLPTLSYRRLRGDMIETYKILTKKYDENTVPFLKMWKDAASRFSKRENNSLAVFPQQSNHELRRNAFALRIFKTWNGLPEDLVNAPSVNSFKNGFDKLFKNHEIVYDNYRFEI